MKFIILTLFPEMFESFFNSSILKRAIGTNKIEVEIINFRDYTKDKYHRVDTPPIGGGAGLILKCQPIVDALNAMSTSKTHKIILSPRGEKYTQSKAIELAKNYDEILILCGHYEGYDNRIYKYFDEEISIGDFILTGGEPASMCIIDSISRLLDGVISKDSIVEESFSNSLLEYPQFTEPYNFNGDYVPDILYSGNHEAINKWRKKESFILTKNKRPDLYSKYEFSKSDLKLIKEIDSNTTPKWELSAIEKGKKFIKNKD